MALVLNYTAASSNLPAFLTNWEDNAAYRGDGWFNSVYATSDQWLAGTPVWDGVANNQSSVIVNGTGFSKTPGVVDGTVNTLELGANLVYTPSTDTWTQDAGLSVDLNGSALTAAWNTAISDLSQNGSLDGLYAYFAEQGTIQNGTDGDDVMLSFGGDDVFTGGLGNDTFVFADNWANDTILDFGNSAGDDDVLDLSGVSEISGYLDLILNHSNFYDWNDPLTISVGSNTLTLEGYVGTDIFGLVLDGSVLV